jgi:hypothetical protein
MLCDRPTAADMAITSRLSRKLHPVLPLRHAVAHRRNAAGDLADRIGAVQRFADDIRVVFIGLVRGQHIVVGGNDGDIVAQHAFQRGFVIRLAGSKAVGQITAGQLAHDERCRFWPG